MAKLGDIDDATLIKAAEIYFDGGSADAVKEFVNACLAARNAGFTINRNEVHQLIKIAKRRRFFVVVPPREHTHEDRIAHRYRVPASSVHVANSDVLAHVASSAADVVLELIMQLQEKKHGQRLRIGLGGGWTTMLVASELAIRLGGLTSLPRLTLHALSSGFDINRPQTAPVSFFSLFQRLGPEIDYVGLFAPAAADTGDYPKIKRSRGVRESFALRLEIDLVITSLGSASHRSGDFSKFMERGSRAGIRALRGENWIGDVQYRPYSPSGPILVDAGTRAVTLLELKDLHGMASDAEPDKHVVIVAGPCSMCRHPRTDAVVPLLEAPSLRLWTHLVMDNGTAAQLIPADGSDALVLPPPPPGSPCAPAGA